MKFIETNWPWISSNPWISSSFAILCFGFGWAAAHLYYKERIEVLRERLATSNDSISQLKNSFTNLDKQVATMKSEWGDLENVDFVATYEEAKRSSK